MSGLKIIIAFVGGFLLAQLIKLLIEAIKGAKQGKYMSSFSEAMRYFFRSGGMPSGHAASLVALTTYIGCAEGMSMLFALAVCVTTIVVYDAVNVRLAVGEYGEILAGMVKKAGGKAPRIVRGHTAKEAAAGILLGIMVGLTVFAIFG